MINLKSLLAESLQSSLVQEKQRFDLTTSGGVSSEDKKKAAAVLYKFFKDRETLPWMFAHSWELKEVYHGGYLDGDRYRFDYTAKEGRTAEREPYPDAKYTRKNSVYLTN